MLPRLIALSNIVAENNLGDEHEYRDTEYEYEESKQPVPNRAPEAGLRGFSGGISIVGPR